jgi:beta-ketoacyl-acyl-carrier-protein synthase II
MNGTNNNIPRVVVTGMGAMSPLGSLESYWNGITSGRSGIKSISHFNTDDLKVKIAGEVDFDPYEHIPPKEARRMSRGSQLALIAARMALEDAKLDLDAIKHNGDKTAVAIGSSNSGFELLLDMSYAYTNRGRKPLPTTFVNGLPNLPGHYISREMGATGPLTTISTACASSTQSIGAGVDFIRNGRSNVVFAGGVETLILKEIVAAFDAMTVLARGFSESPEAASKPFEVSREGFVIGEGAGILILESLTHAQERGAHIYAEILGHAASSDAHHITAPDEEGLGAQKAMRWALEDAGTGDEQIDYINAHGTSTQINDSTETKAIKAVFGSRAYEIPVSSTKSMIGHCLGAAGVLETIACVMSIQTGIVHPTINYQNQDPECDLDYVPNESRHVTVNHALSNSFGFGGQNACLVLGSIQ